MRWNFPRTNGGMDYVQDPSSAHFKGSPIRNLVREVIQNSLDAKYDGLAEPVNVTFTEVYIEASTIGGAELKRHIQSCLDRAKTEKRKALVGSYQKALETLDKERIRCLKIVDTGTTGLKDNLWDSLVIQEGSVSKVGSLHGGAYGIGKNAVLNVSDLNTVFYSTHYIGREDRPKGRVWGRIDKLQGKSTLMTHPDPDTATEQLQHIGFYVNEDDEPLTGAKLIPEPFLLGDTGTGVFIIGFNPRSDNWVSEVAQAAIENYFYAIHNKQLTVIVKSFEAMSSLDILHDTLDDLFENRKTPSYHYYRAIRDVTPERTESIGDLGELNAYVLFEQDAPRRIGYINRNGMLVTDSREQSQNPLSVRGKSLWPDYAVAVMPSTGDGDMWVRDMENPSHTSISTGYLPTDMDVRSAKQCFQQARRGLAKIMDEKSGINKPSEISNIKELARLFPELDSGIERDEPLNVRKVQRRPQGVPLNALDSPKEGFGGSGTGVSRDGEKQPRPVKYALNNVRIIPVSETECYIAFTPDVDEDTEISLPLIPAGADAHPSKDPNRRMKVVAISADVANDADAQVSVIDGEIKVKAQSESRVVIKVNTDSPIDGYAFTLTR